MIVDIGCDDGGAVVAVVSVVYGIHGEILLVVINTCTSYDAPRDER